MADTSTNIVASPSEPVASQYSEAGQENNLYYNSGYYDYGNADPAFFAPQAGQQDRQDFFEAITPLTIGTVFFAALMGAMIAPAISSATRGLMDMAIEIPNIEFTIPGTEEEENEVRSLGGSL